MPMKMLDRQETDTGRNGICGEELSQYAYVEYCFRTAEEGRCRGGCGKGRGYSLLCTGGSHASARIMGEINREWVEALSFEGRT